MQSAFLYLDIPYFILDTPYSHVGSLRVLPCLKIFNLHTSKRSLNEDVDLDEFIAQKDDLSGADIKAICSEAGLMALRERRMRVQMADFRAARERVLRTKQEGEPEGLYL